MRILVIDDDERLARAIQRSLMGHDVLIETVPQDAITLAEAADVEGEPFDAVICDLRMPQMNGLDLLARLRGMRQPPMLLLMSGDDDVVDAASVADDILVKPFRVGEVVAAIQRIKDRRSQMRTRRLPRFPKATVEIAHKLAHK